MNLSDLLHGKYILLIEDDVWVRNSLKILFESEGCRVRTYETAEEGLQELKMHAYDIIITDYKLPGLNGIAFLKAIKNRYPEVVKILITAYGSDDLHSKAKTAGARACIDKPLTYEAIIESFKHIYGDVLAVP